MKLEKFTERFNEMVGDNRSDFSFRTLIPYTTITNVMKGTDPRVSMILAILEAVPEISAEWLIDHIKNGMPHGTPNPETN